MAEDEFESIRDLIPDDDQNAVPMYGMKMLVYLDSEGTEQFCFEPVGDVRVASLMGYLAFAQMTIFAEHNR